MISVRRVIGLQPFSLRDRGVEAEKLRYSDADRSECERGPKPGEEGTFCSWTEQVS